MWLDHGWIKNKKKFISSLRCRLCFENVCHACVDCVWIIVYFSTNMSGLVSMLCVTSIYRLVSYQNPVRCWRRLELELLGLIHASSMFRIRLKYKAT